MSDELPDRAHCVCGRKTIQGDDLLLRHDDGGDPIYCYQSEYGLSDESRCMVVVDEEYEDSE